MATKRTPGEGPEQSGRDHEKLSAAEVQALVVAHYTGQIDACRSKVEAGDGRALLDALLCICVGRTPMPDWLSQSLATAIRRYTHAEVRTLDDAFRVTRPKGYNAAAEKERWEKSMLVAYDVHLMHSLGAIKDVALFEAIGVIYEIGKTRTQEYYRSSRWAFEHMPHQVPSGSNPRDRLRPELRAICHLVNWRAPIPE